MHTHTALWVEAARGGDADVLGHVVFLVVFGGRVLERGVVSIELHYCLLQHDRHKIYGKCLTGKCLTHIHHQTQAHIVLHIHVVRRVGCRVLIHAQSRCTCHGIHSGHTKHTIHTECTTALVTGVSRQRGRADGG